MKKKLLSLAVALAMVLTLLPTVAMAEDVTETSFKILTVAQGEDAIQVTYNGSDYTVEEGHGLFYTVYGIADYDPPDGIYTFDSPVSVTTLDTRGTGAADKTWKALLDGNKLESGDENRTEQYLVVCEATNTNIYASGTLVVAAGYTKYNVTDPDSGDQGDGDSQGGGDQGDQGGQGGDSQDDGDNGGTVYFSGISASYNEGSKILPISWNLRDEDGPIDLEEAFFFIDLHNARLHPTNRDENAWKSILYSFVAVVGDGEISSGGSDDTEIVCYADNLGGGEYTADLPLPSALSDGDYTVSVNYFPPNTSSSVFLRHPFQINFGSGSETLPEITIPSAGGVTNAGSAAEAIEAVQSENTSDLAASLEAALSGSGGASQDQAAQKVLEDLAALDKAVQDEAHIAVIPEAKPDAPSALDVEGITIDNAALNFDADQIGGDNLQITLVVDAPSEERTLSSGYDRRTAVQFSMELLNVLNPTRLAVPVVITMPVPSGLTASRVRVLHYHGSGSPTVIVPKVEGRSIRFVVTGFSDFVLAEEVSRSDYSDSSDSSGDGEPHPAVKHGSSSAPAAPSAPPTPAPPSASGMIGGFTDVSYSNAFAESISWALENGILGGYADGSFRPDANTNRQQMWMVLARLAGTYPTDMAAARTWAIDAGITDGANAQGAMSRQQLITMLYRFAQRQGKTTDGAADLSGYGDSGSVESYAKEALAWGVGNGIITGTSDGRLDPTGTATRAHFAAFLYRYANLPAAPVSR